MYKSHYKMPQNLSGIVQEVLLDV